MITKYPPYLFFWINDFLSDCKFNCHRKCVPQVPKDCAGEMTVGQSKLSALWNFLLGITKWTSLTIKSGSNYYSVLFGSNDMLLWVISSYSIPLTYPLSIFRHKHTRSCITLLAVSNFILTSSLMLVSSIYGDISKHHLIQSNQNCDIKIQNITHVCTFPTQSHKIQQI